MNKMSNAIKAAAFACGLALASFSSAHAMDFRLAGTKDVIILYMDGEIHIGDEARMLAYVKSNEQLMDNRAFGIILNSPGGNAGEALRLAEDVKGTTILVKDTCASACFFIFASGKIKATTDGAHVGVHSALSKDHDDMKSLAATADLIKMLREMGVPDDICMDMLMTDNDDMHWLTADQLARLNAVRR